MPEGRGGGPAGVAAAAGRRRGCDARGRRGAARRGADGANLEVHPDGAPVAPPGPGHPETENLDFPASPRGTGGAVGAYRGARNRMVGRLEHGVLLDPRVSAALRAVPRHRFVPQVLAHRAYGDTPLPIGAGQTISAPSVVAMMTQALRLRGDETVLEVGTGSGYQTAVLSLLADRVISIERLPVLAARARRALDVLGIINSVVYLGDGSRGRPETAPYDAILVTAGGPEVPASLLAQLAVGGRLVGPFGPREHQELLLLRKGRRGCSREVLSGCRFVDLVGEAGW